MSGKYVDVRLIAQQFNPDAKAWVIIPSSALSDPRDGADWVRLFPLRVSLIDFKHGKMGTAENAKEFRDLLEVLVERKRLRVPYKVAMRQEKEFNPQAPKYTGEDRDPSRIYGATAR